MTLSKNAIALVLFGLSWLGLEVSEAQLVEVIAAVGQIVGFLTLIWNQIDRKDVTGFLWKTPPQD
jgi:hypothetical protein